MKEAIARRALDLGFDACGFTTAESPQNAAQFQRWLGAQRHGEMDYLRRNAHKRVDPKQVLAGARSVICLAASYESLKSQPSGFGLDSSVVSSPLSAAKAATGASRDPRPATRNPQPGGVIARYACFDDYHDVLGERLKLLCEWVNQLGGTGTRSLGYVDTGPFLERDLAQRAGIGFVGKHTNLISRRLGNWILLSQIITTLELEPDTPEKNRCGACTRCLAACPTQAITGPFELDARLCISYLTIELKGPIPVELRPAIGNRIYGCDDCLAVCPWNRFAREGKLMREHARPDLAQIDLIELLALDEAGFKGRFGSTPIARTKWRGLLRNVCVALGNVGNATALPAVQRAANDREPLVAEHARWAMDQIAKREKVPVGM